MDELEEKLARINAKAAEKAKATRKARGDLWTRIQADAPDVAALAAELRRVFRSPSGTKDDAMTRIVHLDFDGEVVIDTPIGRETVDDIRLNRERSERIRAELEIEERERNERKA